MQPFASNAYQLHERLGAGGMGEVFRATHRLSNRQVALKRVHIAATPGRSSQSIARTPTELAPQAQRFELRLLLAQEFQILASLHHPHIVSVLDYGFDEQQSPYFTMELLEAPNTFVHASAGKPTAAKVEMLVQLLQALVYLHRRNLLHRDIKPSNVLVTRDVVKLVDFGIAGTIGGINPLAGTLEFMAPEIFTGHPPTCSSDLYSVGIMAYQLFTGQLPYNVKSYTSFINEIVGGGASPVTAQAGTDDTEMGQTAPGVLFQEPPSGLPVTVVAAKLKQVLEESVQPILPVITKLIARSPADRYSDAVEVIKELSAALGQHFPIETVATRESFLQAAEFVGRERELEELMTALRNAREGKGSIVLIGGESGVGKSRLISELRTRALVRSATVVSNQASTEHGGHYALWAPAIRAFCLDTEVHDDEIGILKDVAPDLEAVLGRKGTAPRPVSPQEAQARLHATVAEVLKRRKKPLVILLEDLQWAGTESLKLLAHLNPILASLPVLIVGNYREDEASAALRNLNVAQRIKLERLDATQIAKLAESILGPAGRQPELVSYLQRQTEGNIFFVVEVLRALAEQSGQLDRVGAHALPEKLLTGGMEQLLRIRLNQLGQEEHELLELAAIAGRRLDLKVLEHANPQQDLTSWLVRCANTAVLETQQGDWQFAHDKIRESLTSSLAAAKRCELHRRVAEAIIGVYGKDPTQDAVLAYHFSRAELPERAYACFVKAGQAAARLYAVKEAQAYFASAIEALLQLPDTPENRRRRIDTSLLLGSVYLWDENVEQVVSLMTGAQELSATLPVDTESSRADKSRLAKVYFTMGRGYFSTNRQSHALTNYQKARDLTRESGEASQSAFYSGMIGHAMVLQGNMGACMPYLNEAITFIEPQGHTPEWMRMVSFRGLSMVARGQVREGIREIQSTLRDSREPLVVATWNSYMATAYMFIQDWVAMRERAAQAVLLCHQINNKFLEFSVLFLQGWAESWIGDFEASDQHRGLALALFYRTGSSQLPDWPAVVEADAALHRGRLDEAIEMAQKAVTAARVSEALLGEGMAQRVWARALLMQGASKWDEAESRIKESIKLFEKGESWVAMAHSLMCYGALAIACDKLATAVVQLESAETMFGTYQMYNAQAQARQLLNSSRMGYSSAKMILINSGLLGGVTSS